MKRASIRVWRGSIMSSPELSPLPERLAAPHERQAHRNHGQTLDRLAERGGLGVGEALAILEDREWRRMDEQAAVDQYERIIAHHEAVLDEEDRQAAQRPPPSSPSGWPGEDQ